MPRPSASGAVAGRRCSPIKQANHCHPHMPPPVSLTCADASLGSAAPGVPRPDTPAAVGAGAEGVGPGACAAALVVGTGGLPAEQGTPAPHTVGTMPDTCASPVTPRATC